MSTPKRAPLAGRDVSSPGSETADLPVLFRRLGEDVTDLFDTKVALLRVEMKQEVNTFTRGIALIVIGSTIAAIGFALVNIALALGVSELLANTKLTPAGRYALGFVIIGVFYLLLGSIIAAVMKARLSRQRLVPPETAAELRRDKRWLWNEV